MSYHYVQFINTPLPILNPSQDHSPVQGTSTLLDVLGGYFDYKGSRIAKPQVQNISLSGIVWGKTEYWVDEASDSLVDETGDYLIWGDVALTLRSQFDELAALVMQRGTLWRKRFDDEALQWKTARLLHIGWPQIYHDRLFKAELTLDFESKMNYWHAESPTTVSGSAASGTALSLLVYNAGLYRVDDPTLSVTSISGTITAITITCVEAGVSLSWIGSLALGATLVIECGDVELPAGATNAFAGLSMNPGHTLAGWLSLPLGYSTYTITVTGGSANVSLSFYDQF